MASYTREENKKDALGLFDMVQSLKKCKVPVIARVNGAAVGGGAGLVAASDIAVGVKSCVFGFTEVKLGKETSSYVSCFHLIICQYSRFGSCCHFSFCH